MIASTVTIVPHRRDPERARQRGGHRQRWLGARLPVLVFAAALSLGLGAAGCGPTAVAPANLDGTWPEAPGDYQDVHQEWTRHGILQKYPVQVLELFATLKSPAWRAAHVGFVAEQEQLSASERAALVAREQAASEGPYELHLLVTTNDRRENQLTRSDRSPWTLALIAADGSVLEVESIERDRRPRVVIAAEYPQLGDFAEVYVVRFPRSVELFGPDRERITLRMSSLRGAVELVWGEGS